jgi:hypothetical protein
MTDMRDKARGAARNAYWVNTADGLVPTRLVNAVADAAVLAALDLSEDAETFRALVTAIAVADDGHPDGLKYREQAKAALLVLSEHFSKQAASPEDV